MAINYTINLLQLKWRSLFLPKQYDQTLGDQLFNKLFKNYHSRKRHYHNAEHIINMLKLSDLYAVHLQQKDVVDLAIFYHDVIYNPLRKDNEERSARRAARELKQLHFTKEKIELIKIYILATKTHDLQGFSKESDLAYLLDFDLAILGADWETYLVYTQNIRKEYHIYPESMYKPGRAKVLQHFLEKPRIYYTNVFYQNSEAKARENLGKELEELLT